MNRKKRNVENTYPQYFPNEASESCARHKVLYECGRFAWAVHHLGFIYQCESSARPRHRTLARVSSLVAYTVYRNIRNTGSDEPQNGRRCSLSSHNAPPKYKAHLLEKCRTFISTVFTPVLLIRYTPFVLFQKQ